MTVKNKIVPFLLAVHLVLIFLGTSLFDFARVPSALQSPIAFYLAITGGHPYNFFSPDIPSQIVVDCYITDSAGQVSMETFDRKSNIFQLRANYLFQMLTNGDNPETAAQVAAQYCFKKHRDARSVKVLIDRFVVPTVEEHKQGKQCSFSELYTQTYRHE